MSRIVVLALLCLTLGVRLIGFGAESLWYDETFSAYLAAQPVPDLIAHTARDIHPPAYYLLLHAWQLMTSPTVGYGYEYLLAWPSLWMGMVIPALLYAIGRQTAGPRAGQIALLLSVVHPTHLWYAQEVRMYAPAALAVLLAFWATIRLVPDRRSTARLLAVYATGALLALYTLYFALFWLVALNVGLLWSWRRRLALRDADTMHSLRSWLLTQVLVAIGYLPWLPNLVRQAVEPPVPAWRPDLQNIQSWLAALMEAIVALWIGPFQNVVLSVVCLCLTIGLFWSFYYYAKQNPFEKIILPITFVSLPLLLMLTLSAVGPNLYHVRYTALSASALPLLPALLLARPTQRPKLTAAAVIGVLAVQLGASFDLKTNPAYRADDHRAAVRTLAELWRPGDAILVNAGWAYTAIATYWPQSLRKPLDARPAQLGGFVRLGEKPPAPQTTTPIVYRSGSVDGPPSLGWGRADADFFAISPADTEAALNELARDYRRIWHYRIYDTVSDPHAHIRSWLVTHATQALAIPVPGPAYLLLERYDLPSRPVQLSGPANAIEFHSAATLRNWLMPAAIAAGDTLYVELVWQTPAHPGAKASLRLIDEQGRLVAQTDEQIPAPAGSSLTPHRVALPISAATSPTLHHVILMVYDEATLVPYPVGNSGASAFELASVTIASPDVPIPQRTRLARFDYVELESASPTTHTMNRGDTIDLRLVWRPRSSPYVDDYTMEFMLVPTDRQANTRIPIKLGDFALGPPGYPSSKWRANFPVARTVTLRLSPDVAPGLYRLQVGIKRSSDQAVIPRTDWSWPPRRSTVHLTTVAVRP